MRRKQKMQPLAGQGRCEPFPVTKRCHYLTQGPEFHTAGVGAKFTTDKLAQGAHGVV